MNDEQNGIKEYFDKQYSQWLKKGEKEVFCRGFWYAPCQKEALDRIGNLDGKKVLILGVGRGNEVRMFSEHQASIVTIDIAPASFDKNENGELVCEGGIARGFVMDAQQMSFADDSFDIVYLQSMLCHVSKAVVAKEISRVLKPGGCFILLEEMGKNPWAYLYRKLFFYKSATPYNQFTSEEDILAISKCFKNEIYSQNYYIFTIIYYILRILWVRLKSDLATTNLRFKLTNTIEKIAEKLLGIERRILCKWPSLKKYSFIQLIIYEK